MYKENILLTKKRKTFSRKSVDATEIPDLLSVQRESFDLLIQADKGPTIPDQEDGTYTKREYIGLERVFKSSFPIDDYNNKATINCRINEEFNQNDDVESLLITASAVLFSISPKKWSTGFIIFEENKGD